jgi:hypothetical protein
MPATDQQRTARKYRTGTNVRHRQQQISVRLTAQEYAAVKAAADREGRTPAAMLRHAFFCETESDHSSDEPTG